MRAAVPALLVLLWAAPARAGRLEALGPETTTTWTTGESPPVSATPWWQTLGDTALAGVLDAGLGGNLDLQAAWGRLDQARAGALQAASPLMPSVTFDITTSTQPIDTFGFQFSALGFGGGGSAAAAPPATEPTTTTPTGTTTGTAGPPGSLEAPAAPVVPELPELFHSGQGALNARWVLDVFGRQTLAWRASHHEASAAEGDRAAQAIAVTTLIAEAYYDVAVSRARVRVIEDQILAQEQLLELLRLRFEAGSATGLDVLQQQQALAGTRAILPPVRAGLRARELQLALLLGRPPADVPTVSDILPPPAPLPPLGRPADLADNRPDVRAAAERLTASHQRSTSAKLGFAPTLSASAAVGRQFTWLTEYDDQPFWNVGVGVSVPVFQGGAVWSGVRQARGAEHTAIATWNQGWLSALQEVEAAVAADVERRAAHEAAVAQEEAARATFDESRDRYLAGLDSYLTVLQSQAALQNAELNRLQAHRDLLSARIQLHDALGGPWTNDLWSGASR